MRGVSPPENAGLPDLLRHWARHGGDRPLYRHLVNGEDREEVLTAGEFLRQVNLLSDDLRARYEPGTRLLLMFPTGLEFLVAFCSALCAGMIAVPIPAVGPNRFARAVPRLLGIVQDCRPGAILTTPALSVMRAVAAETSWELAVPDWRSVVLDPADPRTPSDHFAHSAAEDIAFLQYTSGSTAAPKGVIVTFDNLRNNQRAIGDLISRTDRPTQSVAGWLPHYHDMGLAEKIFGLFHGVPTTFFSPAHFVQKPVRWLDMLSRYKASTTCAPNFALEVCAKRIPEVRRGDIDLSALNYLILGAEPIAASTLDRFAATFRDCGFRSSSYLPSFGMAETTVLATGASLREPVVKSICKEVKIGSLVYPPPNGNTDTRRVVSCGPPPEGHSVEIVEPESKEILAEGFVGEIWYRGPSVGAGYWQSEPSAVSGFNGTLADGRSGYLRTGDLGLLIDQELFIVGRIKDVIITRGRNIFPQDIEHYVAASIDGVSAHGVVAIGSAPEEAESEAVVILVEAHRTLCSTHDNYRLHEIAMEIHKEIQSEFEITVQEVVLVGPNRLPKTSSGKLRRMACHQQWKEELFPRLADSLLQDQGEVRV
ncbi:fatty acyl-AMP ligase [Parerythrobacter aestuarii]|uniref:fatty acyl-AMP ligase n=1 Tax=Parerythrobacter aestuarii TaxID=3020909 RepID=UPI0024DE4C2F|nr:fatty acyl-AMP ligase [Parerythrobacter aestuarii]